MKCFVDKMGQQCICRLIRNLLFKTNLFNMTYWSNNHTNYSKLCIYTMPGLILRFLALNIVYIYAERNKIIDMLEKTMQKPSIPLISCKLFNLYQDVKLNKYSLSIAYLFNSLSIEPIIWFLFFLFPLNLTQLAVCLFLHWSFYSYGYIQIKRMLYPS